MTGRAQTPVVILAKAPVPGQVKTRLSPALGAVAAARVYTRLLERTVRVARAAMLGPVSLVGLPDCQHPVLASLAQRFSLTTATQRGDDLGERMFNALAAVLEGTGQGVLLGSDCMDVTVTDLHDAATALAGGRDVVLGPTCDGGYALIGARRLDRRLFHGIDWSTPAVAAQTRHAILALGWSFHSLRLLRDLDEPRDLALLPGHWLLP